MRLKPKPPFDFARTLRFILSPPALLNSRSFAPLLDYIVDGEYRRVAEIEGQPVLYGVSEGTTSGARSKRGEPELRVRILAGPADQATERAVMPLLLALVERQFSTRLELAPFYRLAAADPVLSELVRHFRGMRIPQAPGVYETVISAIIEQQVNLSFAHQVKKALIDAYGTHLEFEGRRYHAFPRPATLAITTPRELLRLQVSGPKARYIIELSRAALDGTVDLEGLRSLEPELARSRLLAHKGVGPWTADYVALRALGHLDSLPAADVGLQKSIQYFYHLLKLPSSKRVEKLGKAWAGWRSYATFYLWLTYWEDRAWKENLRREIRSGLRGAGARARTRTGLNRRKAAK